VGSRTCHRRGPGGPGLRLRAASVTAAAHIAARRVMKKTGLTYRGTRYWMNPNVPAVWYAIDQGDWQAHRAAGRVSVDRGVPETREPGRPPAGAASRSTAAGGRLHP